MGTDKNKQKKYVSVRKALRELRVDEGELKKIIEDGGIKAYPSEKNNVKFDADEIEKYRTSRVQSKEQDPKIADESLYESADVSFDSLFVSQSQGRSAASLTEEIPQEPDILFGPSTAPKQNIKDFLNKKKPEPVSPVKAIQNIRSREKSTTGIVSYGLFIVIIMLVSINSFLLLQVNTPSDLPQIKTTKTVSDELLPTLSIMGDVSPAKIQTIISPINGKIDKLLTNKKLNKDQQIMHISARKISEKESINLQQALLAWELQKKKIKNLPAKAQKEISQISEMYRKSNRKLENNRNAWQKDIGNFAKNVKYNAFSVWLELQKAQQNYIIAQSNQNAGNMSINAPFVGILHSSYVKAGANVEVGQVLGEYYSTVNELQVEISKKEYQQINLETTVTVILPNDEEEKGKIRSVVVNGEIVKLGISIKTPLNLGMKLRAIFSLTKIPECILVERRALFFEKDIRGKNQAMLCKVLYKKEKIFVYPVSVATGYYDEEYIQILSGVDSGETIAISKTIPLAALKSGQEVQK
ncbi:efflux RND transporter periplasmic adaptor subunit [Candidatus Uabimicrobium sp. HlEnr_7]|uniref:efflux RND transporter periplasmic adaptor subunit n=1 Tax=Candidatus Uabimicrobium helgolandensis TaxID=3095367 RepID=UPI00355877F6